MAEFRNETMQVALKNMVENRNDSTINEMIKALVTTQFLVPATWDKDPAMDEKGQMVFAPNTKFQLMIIENEAGKEFFPMFTDMEELRKWDTENQTRSLVLTYEQFISFIEMAKDDIEGIVLDPFGANVPLTTTFLLKVKEILKGDLQENKIKKGDKVRVCEPRDCDDLKKALQEAGKQDTEIRALYLKERIDSDKPNHWFIIVDTENEDVLKFENIGHICFKASQRKEMEFMFASTNLAQSIMKNTVPVYQR